MKIAVNMKRGRTILLLLCATLAAGLALAQTQNTPNTAFTHIIIIVQENRTPDNLFGSDAFATTKQLPGADLTQGGPASRTPS